MKWSFAVVFVVGLCASAWAKPKVAILGLEVTSKDAKVELEQVRLASDLTSAIRSSAKTGTGPFSVAPNSEKELVEEKLSGNCENEAVSCMAAIGDALGADELIYGHLEKQGDSYVVTMTMLDVKRKATVRRQLEKLSGADAKEMVALAKFGKSVYRKLAGIDVTGTVALKANVATAKLLVDGAERGTLAGGTVRLELPEGKHKIAIEVAGYQRWESDVTVRGGETTTVDATLRKR